VRLCILCETPCKARTCQGCWRQAARQWAATAFGTITVTWCIGHLSRRTRRKTYGEQYKPLVHPRVAYSLPDVWAQIEVKAKTPRTVQDREAARRPGRRAGGFATMPTAQRRNDRGARSSICAATVARSRGFGCRRSMRCRRSAGADSAQPGGGNAATVFSALAPFARGTG